jgi:hypothetical protein
MPWVVPQVEADPQLHAMSPTRPHHLDRFVNTHGHGLFDQHMFPRLCGDRSIRRVEEVGRGDKDYVHPGVSNKGLQRRVGDLRPVFGRKRLGPCLIPATDGDQLRVLCPTDSRRNQAIGMFSWADERPSYRHRSTSSRVSEMGIREINGPGGVTPNDRHELLLEAGARNERTL